MKRGRIARSWLVFAAGCGFMAGMLVMAALVLIFPDRPTSAGTPAARALVAPPPNVAAVMEADPLDDLRKRRLEMPVLGAQKSDVSESFNDRRGSARRHQAIDMLAPRHTPVVAVEDGTVEKLFHSQAGGITVYQFDPSTRYVYYYAHLEHYAQGLAEGALVRRGQILGYVGTSGNAPKDTPHLHFAIFKLTEKKQWWQGAPIDPYQVLR